MSEMLLEVLSSPLLTQEEDLPQPPLLPVLPLQPQPPLLPVLPLQPQPPLPFKNE
ncbi:hypothetical protein [Polycladomyces subterraneus]|uniref:Uncharacterized protein n=1 Tax=Polycladomyces subterraneus TaxID=1016997 RepID=A0ABT8IR00_9BACL|nr:hypothetical protein [Polycladomyces subterraneus]MDN4595236.1 hypothetical protein [Polycladomyces subterraneus]